MNNIKIGNSSKRLESKLNKAIKLIGEDVENFRYNLAVIKLRALLDNFIEEDETGKQDVEKLLLITSIFMPHICEEIWERLGNKGFIINAKWPEYDEKKIDKNLEEQELTINKTLADINNILNLIKDEAKNIYLYVLPNELKLYDQEKLSDKLGKSIKVFAVNDKNKHDPENKSKKAKPGRPGIYVE